MNNFTKTETLPKSGHVNEVCKEWLVREDGALAYKLQSQEINDFYKGNRFRNAVVREDFPTALHEQIREREQADRQAELYRRRLVEQEEHDKRVAREIAEKLERDLQEQQQRELHENELIAQQMQEIYVNLPPPPPPAGRDKSKPPPPRPAKTGAHHSGDANASTSTSGSSSSSSGRHFQQLQQQQQQLNGPVGGLVLVSDEAGPQQQQQPLNQFVDRPAQHKGGRPPPALNIDNFPSHPHHHQQQHQAQNHQQLSHQHLSHLQQNHQQPNHSPHHQPQPHHHRHQLATGPAPFSPLPTSYGPASSASSPTSATSTTPTTARNPGIDEFVEYSDVADSIRRYDISPDRLDRPDAPSSCTSTNTTTPTSAVAPTTPLSPTHAHAHAHSMVGGLSKALSPSSENLLRADHKFQKLSPEKYDQLVGNDLGGPGASGAALVERHMQQHADDIELYVDPCDYAGLEEIGLPLDEIKEMSKKIKQEQKDEMLARRLQEMEANDGLTQEERDRLLAIEAQDKELAKMLQEREKVKAKRAKEKARLRKSQHKEAACATSTSTSSGLHCGPLLPLPMPLQDCMSSSSKHSTASSAHSAAFATPHADDDLLDLEAYSNPIDVINQQRLQEARAIGVGVGGVGGSLSRDPHALGRRDSEGEPGRDDDIYTLPVDSCRPSGARPASLGLGHEGGAHGSGHNSMTRSENYSLESHESLGGHDVSPRMAYAKQGSFDQSSSPTPPYMPIQGTRRSNSSEERKKKSKDKCTHQ